MYLVPLHFEGFFCFCFFLPFAFHYKAVVAPSYISVRQPAVILTPLVYLSLCYGQPTKNAMVLWLLHFINFTTKGCKLFCVSLSYSSFPQWNMFAVFPHLYPFFFWWSCGDFLGLAKKTKTIHGYKYVIKGTFGVVEPLCIWKLDLVSLLIY